MDTPTTDQPTTSNRQLRLESLTGLRWLAALGVFFHHVWEGHPLTNVGPLGVTFFFVLSGFVLAWGSTKGTSVARFYRNRVARIVPTMVVAVLVGAVITKMATWQLVFSLFGLQAWSTDKAVYYGGNGVVWSLTCELFFYLTFPYCVRLLQRMTRSQRRWLVCGLVAVSVALRVAMGAWESLADPATFNYWLFAVCPVMRLPEFLVGIVLAFEIRDGLRFKYATALGFFGFTLMAVVTAIGDLRLWWNLMALVPVVLIIMGASQTSMQGQRSWLASPLMVWLGELSFCFYLFHYEFIDTIPGLGNDLVPVFALSMLASVAAHYLIEKPFNKLIRG